MLSTMGGGGRGEKLSTWFMDGPGIFDFMHKKITYDFNGTNMQTPISKKLPPGHEQVLTSIFTIIPELISFLFSESNLSLIKLLIWYRHTNEIKIISRQFILH